MRIGELAKRSGLSRDTLRFYEKQGLIASQAEQGGTNSYRSYAEDTLITLDWIAEAQAAGLSLADLVILLGQLEAEAGEDFDGFAYLDAKIAEVENRIAQSRKFLKTLQQTRAALARAPHSE